MRHKDLVKAILQKAQRLFRIRVYDYAICGNHLHCLVLGKTRGELQNFFRVFAGHLAQELLNLYPLSKTEEEKLAESQRGCQKNRRRFWALLIYTRVVTWGREFRRVKNYIAQNTLEALFLIAYRPRSKSRSRPDGPGP